MPHPLTPEALPVDVAELVRELERARPADAHEHIQDIHERRVALAMVAKDQPILSKIPLNDCQPSAPQRAAHTDPELTTVRTTSPTMEEDTLVG